MIFSRSVVFCVLLVQQYRFLTPAQANYGTVPPTICEPNLGDSFGSQQLAIEEWPTLSNGLIKGIDDGISFFVSGDYECQSGAEIEGSVVVLGDFTVNAGTLSNIGVVGYGSAIVPSAGGDNLIVAGNLVLDKLVQYMFTSHANVLVGGSISGSVGALAMNSDGTVHENALNDIGVPTYEQMFRDLRTKSNYWSSLPQNGVYTRESWGPLTFSANTPDDLQVFHIDTIDLQFGSGVHVNFESSLQEKTVLINVKSDENGVVRVRNLASFFDGIGGSNHVFDPKTIAHIIWNFYDANEVHLGDNGTGNGEFIGTVLIPTPDSKTVFTFPGHSGRFIANGDVIQNKGGSEFHNYAFDPIVPLPTPPNQPCPPGPGPPGDDDDTNGGGVVTTAPTATPDKIINVDDEGCKVEMRKRYLENGQVEWTTIKTCRHNCDCPPEESE